MKAIRAPILDGPAIERAREQTRQALRDLPAVFTITRIAEMAGLPPHSLIGLRERGTISEARLARLQAVLVELGILAPED